MAHNRSLLEGNHWREVVQNNQERQSINNKNCKSHSFDGQPCRDMHPSSQTQKPPQTQTPERGPSISKRRFMEILIVIHGEQTQCWRKQDALRKAAVNTHLEPIPGLTLSFAAAIILWFSYTEDSGKGEWREIKCNYRKKIQFFKIISLLSRN